MAKIKRFLAVPVCMAMVAAFVPCVVGAAEVTAGGTCGDNLTWIFTDDGVLTISGTGAMTDYSYNTTPWYSYRYAITSVVVEDGVTSIGGNAFNCYYNLTTATIPDSVTRRGRVIVFTKTQVRQYDLSVGLRGYAA